MSRYVEVWEKPLGFLQFDWAGVSLDADSAFSVEFLTMHGGIYHRQPCGGLEASRQLLLGCKFRPFVPTPERLQFRHPFQVSAVHIGNPDVGRRNLEPG